MKGTEPVSLSTIFTPETNKIDRSCLTARPAAHLGPPDFGHFFSAHSPLTGAFYPFEAAPLRWHVHCVVVSDLTSLFSKSPADLE